MIEITTTVSRYGSDGAVEIPEEELRRHNIAIGDEVKVSVKRLDNDSQNRSVNETAQKILDDNRTDFKNLSVR